MLLERYHFMRKTATDNSYADRLLSRLKPAAMAAKERVTLGERWEIFMPREKIDRPLIKGGMCLGHTTAVDCN